jgi:hypothetical protein
MKPGGLAGRFTVVGDHQCLCPADPAALEPAVDHPNDGAVYFVINALLLMLVSKIVPAFQVAGFWSAFFGAIVISFVSWLLSSFFRGSDGRFHVITHHAAIKRANAR